MLGDQGNERNVELIVCTAWEESCGVLKVRIRSVIVMQDKSGDSPGIERTAICQKAETVRYCKTKNTGKIVVCLWKCKKDRSHERVGSVFWVG